MLQSAHIFIGKEYVELLEKVGLSFIKHNKDAVAFNHFYNVIGEDGGKMSFQKLDMKASSGDDETIVWSEKELVSAESLPGFWSDKIFDKILTIQNASQGLLYVFIHIPLYKKKSLDTVKELCTAINKSERPVNIDFVGYCEDLYKIIEPEGKEKIDSARESVPFIKEFFKDLNYTPQQNNMIVIQNRTMNGVALLNEEDGPEPFFDMIANLSLLFSSHYDKIFSVINASSLDVLGIGFSSLYFDKYIFAKYLLQKTMLGAIDNQRVNNKDVDVNRANVTAIDILEDKETIFSKFLDIWRNREDENPEYDSIRKEIEEIIERTLTYFNNDKDMTAKAAVLASILSKCECELFASSFSTINTKCYEDLYNEVINYFIEQDDVRYYTIVDDEKPINPINELKKVTRTLVQTEVQIRNLEKQIEGYEEQIEKNDKVKECFVDDGYFSFDDKKFRLLPNIDEEPLKDNYEAHEVKVESVDLRNNFSRVKNQGQQGSCLSFTLTSIFEYMMRICKQEDCDLSEAFLYYNARNLDENESVNNDNGSRFHPSIESLSKYGIALEKYWPYNDSVYNTRPSEEAYKDAATRKLIKALNVERSVAAIKSALSDGYPVAASFTLYPSFNQNGPYIQMPTREEMEESASCEESVSFPFWKKNKTKENDGDDDMSRHARHAMTIVGFSDDLQMFLVRNSWGEDWGDKGYCYIPYSYIQNKDLFNFACIITEVDSLSSQKPELREIPSLKINNGDIQIRYYVALASLSIQTEKIEEYKTRRIELLKYLEVQKSLYSDPNARDEFIEANVKSLEERNQELSKEIKHNETKQEEIFEVFKKRRLKDLIFCGVSIVVSVVLFIIISRLNVNFVLGMGFWFRLGISLIPSLYIIVALIKFNGYRNEWREERDQLQSQIDRNKKEIYNNTKRIKSFRHKTFAAWKTITSLCKCQSQLEQMYTKLINLINNLRIWYIETQNSTAEIDFSSCFPNISILDKERIDTYFETNICNSKVCDVDLCKDIANHQISADYLAEYKSNLKKELTERLMGFLEKISFNISEHITSGKFNNLAKDINNELINNWHSQANIFLHVKSNERPIITPNNIVFAPNLSVVHHELSRKLEKLYASFVANDDNYKMTVASIVTLKFDECVALHCNEDVPKTKKK